MNEGEFRNYHRLFDEHAGADLCDDGDVAERARKIGETTLRSIRDMSQRQCLENSNEESVARNDDE